MKKRASFASIICMVLSACGAGVTDQRAPQTRARTAGDIMDSAATAAGGADSAAGQASGAATDVSTEPGPEESNPRLEQQAEATRPLAATPAPAPAPPPGTPSPSPAVIYIN
ncbi:hypothetical protein AB4Z32_00455 [Massilia sp. 2TAF26]|uniref:hypothetical protein n=1 Tax=Massilia sp. 2TAF26 TaxID=3233012 RepID=UPI003F955A46